MNQIVAFDVETPNRRNDRICSIGITIIKDGVIENTLHFLVNPEVEFDNQNIAIHGIKPVDVRDAPSFPEIWTEITGSIRPRLIAAHNASFDLSVLRKTLTAYGINAQKLDYVCTLQMARKIISGIENYSLSTLCRHSGIELQHHDAASDSNGCAALLCYFLNSGANIEHYIKSYDFTAENTVNKTYINNAITSQTQSLLELKGIISGITCDDILLEQEIMYLQKWLDDNYSLRGNYPYDKILSIISGALADGILEQSELESMLILFKSIFDPVGSLTNNQTSKCLVGKNICLTGEFDRGDKGSLEKELTLLGATCQNSVTRQTEYLIVGGQGSSMWCAGNYGTKVKKALEMQCKGVPIQIMKESDFYLSLED